MLAADGDGRKHMCCSTAVHARLMLGGGGAVVDVIVEESLRSERKHRTSSPIHGGGEENAHARQL